MMKFLSAFFGALVLSPSLSLAITFQFETLSVANGAATFDAEVTIDNLDDFSASARILNFENFISVETDSSSNFDSLTLSYSFEGGSREIFLTSGGIALSSPDNDSLFFLGNFSRPSDFFQSTTGFGFSGSAPSFLGLWTIQFGSDDTFVTLPTLTGRFISDDLVRVAEPAQLLIIIFGLGLIWLRWTGSTARPLNPQ